MKSDEFTALNDQLDLVLKHVDGIQRDLQSFKHEVAARDEQHTREHAEHKGQLVEIAADVKRLDQERIVMIKREDRIKRRVDRIGSHAR